ncbi:uncharacterized protein L3040_002814 [Drepanopeziza brunnea f. sp. 'multigermtubi']|nr:hypothetical protein L3040_002814 [Drepanopeziza brunnea f. sp. 'multigermtubi']
MKWFTRAKGKSKKTKDAGSIPISISNSILTSTSVFIPYNNYSPRGTRCFLTKLPIPLLERIFAFVCPHARDQTYESCEDSAVEDACMLCDLRDLSHCAQVSRKWREAAVRVLYHSIRIDAVHYCPLEDVLAEKRKRKSFMRHNQEPEDTAAARLRFLARTLYDNKGGFALNVQYLKTPYMTRETCKADLARAVSCCPNLRYLDLPEGVFQDDPSCTTLKHEIQGRCPELRKMTYIRGSERGLEALASGHVWHHLEVLELGKLNVDPVVLRQALGSLPNLHALKVTDMASFHDQLFTQSEYLPPFPALAEMIFENIPNLTADGIAGYLFRSDAQETLKTLSLTATGVHPQTLHSILAVAPNLKHLSITESVTTSFPAADVPSLSSKSLETFHYEITAATSANTYANTTASHYAYLTRSLIAGGLPSLTELYVRDPYFAETLLDLAPPLPAFAADLDNLAPPKPFAAGHKAKSLSLSSNNPFAKLHQGPGLRQELQVFSKGSDEMEWNFSKVKPPPCGGKRGSATVPRPLSSYGLTDSMGRGWNSATGGARQSVIVGNGFGGFLAVPADGGRPSSSAGERNRGSQYDMWR